MPQYYVEGLFISGQAVKKKRKTGHLPAGAIEPYAKSIWADTPKEAIRIATEELDDGEWTEAPNVSQISEEQRMRSMGAPELPGFSLPRSKKNKRRK